MSKLLLPPKSPDALWKKQQNSRKPQCYWDFKQKTKETKTTKSKLPPYILTHNCFSKRLLLSVLLCIKSPPDCTGTSCTPGRLAVINTWCGAALNSSNKIPPFFLPVGWCLSNEVTSCHVTPPLPLQLTPPHPLPSQPSQQPTCVDFSLNPLHSPSTPHFSSASLRLCALNT